MVSCEFGNFVDNALRDRLVCGIYDQAQKRLLCKVDLTLTRALQTSLSIKAADARAKEMKGGESSILRVSSTCYHCGKACHEPKLCRYKAAKCHKCKKVGHILPVCRSKVKKIPAGQGLTTAEESKVEARSVRDNEVGGSCGLISTSKRHAWH